MAIDRDTADELLNVLENPGLQTEIAQLRAQGVLQDIGAQTSDIRWRYVWSRVLRNATGALIGLETRAADLARGADEYPLGRRLAQLWESIAKLEQRESRVTALANAAVAYELSGYQAAAACLARDLAAALAGGQTTFEKLVATFLQRQFLLVKALGTGLLREPPPDAPANVLWVAASEAFGAKALMSAAQYFLSGSEQDLLAAARLLERAEEGYTRVGLVRPAVLSRSLNSTLAVMAQRSTWRRLKPLLPENAVWDRYLRLLARGLERDVLRGSSISELWPSQLHAIENGLFDRSSAKIVRMPTSAGKTRIAEMAIVHALVTRPGSLCVYVAPYRALAGEVEAVLSALLSDLGFAVSSLAGAYETDSFELALAATADVLVLTPEKLDLLDRLTPSTLDRVALVLLDESQLVADRSRGPKFELLVTRLRRRLPDCTFVSLSAVVSEQTLVEFATWLGGGPEDISSSRWRPSVQRVARFEWNGALGVLRYAPSDDTEALAGFVPGIVSVQEISFVHPETQRRRTKRFPDPTNKAQVAAALAIQASELGQVLIFCAVPMFADAAANAVVDRLAIGRLAGEPVIPRFVVGNTRSLQLAREWLGAEHATTRALEAGIAVHHGGVPDVVREAVERDFRERRYPVLVATNTLAQGVNLPVRTVVVHSVRRYDEEHQQSVRLPSRDYWNVAGRAGRAREETEGTIIHIIANPRDRADYDYYLRHRTEVEPLESALFGYLRDLVANRLSEQAVAERLDPEVLALLVEEDVHSAEEVDMALAVLTDTLGWAQARTHAVESGPLSSSVRRAANQILEAVPDASLRRLFSSTGLSSTSCRTLHDRITGDADRVREAITSPDEGAEALVDLIVPLVVDLPEMILDIEIEASHDEVMRAWIRGTDAVELRGQFTGAGTSAELFARFLEQHLGYRLPWGMSGYLRIARGALEIPEEGLSANAQYLPAMLKFGVSVPAASWAMSLGIPSRAVAQAMGADFARDQPAGTFSEFRTWLGEIDLNDLRTTYGVRPPLLEDVFQVCLRTGSNPRLRAFDGLGRELPSVVPVRGIAFDDRAATARGLVVGQELALRRDYDNIADRNAIVITDQDREVGYLPRTLAQLLAPEMDTGRLFHAEVDAVELAATPHVQVRVTAVTEA